MRELFDHMIHLDLTFDECLHRRTAARSPLNPNPLSPQDVVDLVARRAKRLIGMFTFNFFAGMKFGTSHHVLPHKSMYSCQASHVLATRIPSAQIFLIIFSWPGGPVPQTVALRFGRLMSGTWR